MHNSVLLKSIRLSFLFLLSDSKFQFNLTHAERIDLTSLRTLDLFKSLNIVFFHTFITTEDDFLFLGKMKDSKEYQAFRH